MMNLSTSLLAASLLVATTSTLPAAETAPRPNIIVIFVDDLGYGDLSGYGHPSIRTPHLDRMAAEGMRFTDFYTAASVCTPSRAALMTGRLPVRSGMCSDRRRVLFPDSAGGLPADEVTIAEVLKKAGYATACVGKWHLGHLPEYLPTRHGFDSYYGIPYSNDMDRVADAPGRAAMSLEPRSEWFNVPLLENETEIERPVDQTTITRRYTEKAIEFIRAEREEPFFLYLPHSMVHVPMFRGKDFEGKSARGLYGDSMEEVDWSTGEILRTLRETGLAENTLVVFTSDNGPWLTQGVVGGTAGLLREGKGSTWEGGMRVPAIAWWPGRIEAGQITSEPASTLDLLPTAAALAGSGVPTDRVMDGYDLAPLLLGEGPGPREEMFFYRGTRLFAVRLGEYKAHFLTKSAYGGDPVESHDPPLLFHLGHDPSERFNVAGDHPEVLKEIEALIADHREKLVAAPTQLESRVQ